MGIIWSSLRRPIRAFRTPSRLRPWSGISAVSLNDASAPGTAFVLHSYSLEAGGYSYVVQTALYPADVDVRLGGLWLSVTPILFKLCK